MAALFCMTCLCGKTQTRTCHINQWICTFMWPSFCCSVELHLSRALIHSTFVSIRTWCGWLLTCCTTLSIGYWHITIPQPSILIASCPCVLPCLMPTLQSHVTVCTKNSYSSTIYPLRPSPVQATISLNPALVTHGILVILPVSRKTLQ